MPYAFERITIRYIIMVLSYTCVFLSISCYLIDQFFVLVSRSFNSQVCVCSWFEFVICSFNGFQLILIFGYSGNNTKSTRRQLQWNTFKYCKIKLNSYREINSYAIHVTITPKTHIWCTSSKKNVPTCATTVDGRMKKTSPRKTYLYVIVVVTVNIADAQWKSERLPYNSEQSCI